jgi:hypothetical protein
MPAPFKIRGRCMSRTDQKALVIRVNSARSLRKKTAGK